MPKDLNKASSSQARYLPVWHPDILITMPESEAECEMKSMIVLYEIEHKATDVALLKVLDCNTEE